MKPIPQEVYDAYLAVRRSNFKDEQLYAIYADRAADLLGVRSNDRAAQGELMVNLARMYIDLNLNEGDKE